MSVSNLDYFYVTVSLLINTSKSTFERCVCNYISLRVCVTTGACKKVVLLLLLFYVRKPHCKLDLYMQYFINAVCTCFV